MGGFDDPAPGTPARDANLLRDLLAARAHMRDEPASAGGLAGAVVVVAAIQAQPLRLLGRGLGPLDRDRVERRLEQFQIVAVGAVVRQPDRDPCALAQNRTLRPLFARSVGFGPVFGPPNGAFVIAPSAASHSQSIPTMVS